MKITFRQEKRYLCDLSSRHLQQIFVLVKGREGNRMVFKKENFGVFFFPLKAMRISLKT